MPPTSTPTPPPQPGGMTKKEEIILAFLVTAGIIAAIWGIVWATHQTGNSNTTSSPHTSQQVLQTLQENGPIGTPAVLDEAWTRFIDPVQRFTIDAPDIARIITDKTGMSAVGYQPTCNPDIGIVCVYLPDLTFPKTNFNGAGVSVNTTSDNTSSCLGAKNGEVANTSQRIIGGISFVSFTTSDAAMSHQSSGGDYRAFRNGTCYEITTRINSSTYEVYATGSITRFTAEERLTTNRILEKIVSSFGFLK